MGSLGRNKAVHLYRLRNERKMKNHRIPRLNNYVTNTPVSQTLIYSQYKPNNKQNRPECRVCKQMTWSDHTEI